MAAKRKRPPKTSLPPPTGATYLEVVGTTKAMVHLQPSSGRKRKGKQPSPAQSILPLGSRPAIPDKLLTHELVAGQTFYTLPQPLLKSVKQHIPECARADGWAVEIDLSLAAEQILNCVGFTNGQPIHHDLLAVPKKKTSLTVPKELKSDPAWARITDQHLENVLHEADQRTDFIRKTARAFCGWLMTLSDFVDEYDHFAERWSEQIGNVGFPASLPSVAIYPGSQVSDLVPADATLNQFGKEYKDLCIRWQLKGIVGPYLPEPLRPQFPLLSTNQLTETMRAGGVLVYLPRSFALMGEQDLRNLLEDVLRGETPAEHLRKWAQLAGANRQTKGGEFDRLGRLFELQHYWRVLHQRWSQFLQRKKTALSEAFADFYKLSSKQIDTDLAKVLS